MAIGSKTYSDIISTVVTEIGKNVENIDQSKYDAISIVFKSSYAGTKVYNGVNATNSGVSHIYIKSVTNPIIKVSNTINSDLRTFLNNAGFSNTELNGQITTERFIDFFDNIVSFCSRYLRYSTSQYSSKVYLIYGDTGSTKYYNNSSKLSPDYPKDTIYSFFIYNTNESDNNGGFLNVLKNRLSMVIRCLPVTYEYNFDNVN